MFKRIQKSNQLSENSTKRKSNPQILGVVMLIVNISCGYKIGYQGYCCQLLFLQFQGLVNA